MSNPASTLARGCRRPVFIVTEVSEVYMNTIDFPRRLSYVLFWGCLVAAFLFAVTS